MPHRSITGALRLASVLVVLAVLPRAATAQGPQAATTISAVLPSLPDPIAAEPLATLDASGPTSPRLMPLDQSAAPTAAMMRRHGEGLHFSHPIFTESVSPDTKVRIDADRSWAGDGTESEIGLEGEYAFNRAFSLEVGLPYGFLSPEGGPSSSGLGNLEATLKFANFAFEEYGVLLGYGLSVGFPTGDASAGTGSDHIWDLEPFLNIGIKTGRVELVSWGRFGIPTKQRTGEEVGTEFGYDFAALYHLSPRLQGLAELNGNAGLSGPEAGSNTVSAAAGIKFAPLATSDLLVGIGVAVPLTSSEQDAALRLSIFRHF